jgi:hypothetical protein
MGARLSNPTTGRFTTTDPITGGNENAYNYPNDPIGESDVSGKCNSYSATCLRAVLTTFEPFPLGFSNWLYHRLDSTTHKYLRITYKMTKAGLRYMEVNGDHCSKSPDTGPYWDFTNACDTHDLAYEFIRFYKGKVVSGSVKNAADSLLHSDMYADCNHGRWGGAANACKDIADDYYWILRAVT